MKVYKSLDFESQKKRIEPNEPGEYLVHLEDYESLNDLIRRSVRTKSPFKPESSKDAVYDDVLDEFDEEYQKLIDQNQPEVIKPEENTATAEQSEGQASVNTSGSTDKVDLP